MFDVPGGHVSLVYPFASSHQCYIASRMRDARPVWLLALLPGLFWTGGPETAPALKRAGIEATRLSVEALHARTKLTPPGIDRKVTVASATTAPWVNANGWQIRRAPGREFWYD